MIPTRTENCHFIKRKLRKLLGQTALKQTVAIKNLALIKIKCNFIT